MEPVLKVQSEEEEAREEEEAAVEEEEEKVQRREGGFTASSMASAATPSSCRSWTGARVEDRHHRLNNLASPAAGQVSCRETRRQ